MNARVLPLIAGALALAGCDRPAPAAQGPTSPLQGATEFAACKWGEIRGAGVSIGAFTCGPEQNGQRLVPDESLPGLVLEWNGPDGAVRTTAVRLFSKAVGAPVESVLPAVRKASPGAFTDSCALVPAEPTGRYSLEPIGEAKTRWDASVQSDTPIAEPCGPLGIGIAGDRYFIELPGRATQVAFVELGSEIQIYDAATLRAAP